MGQGFFVLKHRAEIAHVEITAAQFAFPKPCSIVERRATGLPPDYLATLDLMLWFVFHACSPMMVPHGILIISLQHYNAVPLSTLLYI